MANMETIWNFVRPVLIALLLVVLLLRIFEDRLIFFPNVYAPDEWNVQDQGLPFEDVFLTTEDGARIHGWWAPAKEASSFAPSYALRATAGRKATEDKSAEQAPQDAGQGAEAPFTILFLHGNAGNLTNRTENIVFLTKLPANVLAIDYRRYGRSEGPFPTEQGIYRDAQAAYDYLTGERSIPPEQIVLLGPSLGSAVAVDLASKNKVAGLILEAGFPSVRRAAQRVFPLPGVRFILRSRFDSAAKLKDIHVPVLVAHCTGDPVLPFDLGEELFAAANQPKTFVRFDEACHEPFYLADPEDYVTRLRAFLQNLAKPKEVKIE